VIDPVWPLLDGVARRHLLDGALAGRRVAIDVAPDAAADHVLALIEASGAELVAPPRAELVLRPEEVVATGGSVAVPTLDPTGAAHGTIRALLRLTNRRLAGARVAVIGFAAPQRVVAGVVRALGGRVTVVDTDPVHRLAAHTAGHDLGDARHAEIVLGADVGALTLADGVVLAGPEPAAVGQVLDEPRPGMCRVRRDAGEVFVLDPAALAADRAPAWLDLTWAARLVTLAWVAATPDGRELPVGLRRELAAAALVVRGVDP
jgi:hypothetical protein